MDHAFWLAYGTNTMTAIEKLSDSGCPYREALAKRLVPLRELCLVMAAVTRGDMEEGQEVAALQNVLGGELSAEWAALQELVAHAHDVRSQIADLLIKIDKLQGI